MKIKTAVRTLQSLTWISLAGFLGVVVLAYLGLDSRQPLPLPEIIGAVSALIWFLMMLAITSVAETVAKQKEEAEMKPHDPVKGDYARI